MWKTSTRTKALAGFAALSAAVGLATIVIPSSQAAPTRPATPAVQGGPIRAVQAGPIRAVQGGPIRAVQAGPIRAVQGGPIRAVQARPTRGCSTNAFNTGLAGAVLNQTNQNMKRTFAEHGHTGFFDPAPSEHIPPNDARGFCVGSRFGVEAMKVDYQMPNGEKAHFEAYYQTFTGNLKTACSISDLRPGAGASYACAAEEVPQGGFKCSPYVGCFKIGDPSVVKDKDVIFRVFAR